MDCNKYGGVGAKEVIVFQTKIMMGAQFGRILWARDHASDCLAEGQDEMLMACLRMGWNDAFRHTSKNEKGVNDEKIGLLTIKGEVSTYQKKDKYKKSKFKLLRGKIKSVLAAGEFDDFFTDQVLSQKEFLDIFKEYASTQGPKDAVITSNFPQLQRCFAGVKKLTGKQALSFGHIQKLFNIAIKLYLPSSPSPVR